MSRFNVGDKVQITGSITTKHRDREGLVLNVKVSRYNRPGKTSLDKYLVQFADGESREFYDIQLTEPVPNGDLRQREFHA